MAATYDENLALDEARRAEQHAAAKARVESDVQRDLAAASVATRAQEDRVAEVAQGLRSRAVDEVAQTETEVGRARSLARVSQVVTYGFLVLYGLLGLRFVLALLAARSSAFFVKAVVAVTDPFYFPFRGIVPSPRVYGAHTLVAPLIVALVSYGLLHLAILGLLRIFAHRKTAV